MMRKKSDRILQACYTYDAARGSIPEVLDLNIFETPRWLELYNHENLEESREMIRILGLHGKIDRFERFELTTHLTNANKEYKELRNFVLNEPDLSLITFNPRRSC